MNRGNIFKWTVGDPTNLLLINIFCLIIITGGAGYKTLHKIAVRSYKQPFGGKIHVTCIIY